jgi:hypothetical protein
MEEWMRPKAGQLVWLVTFPRAARAASASSATAARLAGSGIWPSPEKERRRPGVRLDRERAHRGEVQAARAGFVEDRELVVVAR